MYRPLTVAAIVALSSIAHAQTTTDAPPAQPKYTVDGTLIPADYFNQAPRGGPTPGPVSTAFTYQGYLENAGAPANAAFDMRFVLLDDLGNTVAGPSCIDNVAVSAGIFTVQLDFGAQFDGRARRLGIAVRPGGPVGDCANPGGYTALTPAQPITATPYALGLRLPYDGVHEITDGSVFTVTNSSPTFGSSTSILGIHSARPPFSFPDSAGVRGEGSGIGVIGVLGITDNYLAVAAYGTGEGATGLFAIVEGDNSIALRGDSSGLNSWAGFFSGRGYFSDNVGIGTLAPEANLHVAGTTRTNALRITDNAGAGRILKSNAQGDGIWTPTGSNFVSGSTPGVTATPAFISQVATLSVEAGQRVLVTASQSLGSTAPGGAGNLSLWIGYRLQGGPTLLTVGGGIFDLTVAQNQRHVFTLSAVVTVPAAGTYQFGMVGSSVNASAWNNNEWGYVTAVILP